MSSIQNVHNWPKGSRCIQGVQNHSSSKSVQNNSEVTNTVQVSKSFQIVQNRQKMSTSAQKYWVLKSAQSVQNVHNCSKQAKHVDSRIP